MESKQCPHCNKIVKLTTRDLNATVKCTHCIKLNKVHELLDLDPVLSHRDKLLREKGPREANSNLLEAALQLSFQEWFNFFVKIAIAVIVPYVIFKIGVDLLIAVLRSIFSSVL